MILLTKLIRNFVTGNIIVFLAINVVHGTNYYYNTPISGFTLFTPGGSLVGGDTLTLNANISGVSTLINTSSSTGNISVGSQSGTGSHTLSANFSNGDVINAGSLNGIFTIASDVNVSITATGIGARAIIASGSTVATTTVNNYGTLSATTSGASSSPSAAVISPSASGAIRIFNNYGTLSLTNGASTTSSLNVAQIGSSAGASATLYNDGIISSLASVCTQATAFILSASSPSQVQIINDVNGVVTISTDKIGNGLRFSNSSTGNLFTNNGSMNITATNSGAQSYGINVPTSNSITITNTGTITASAPSGTSYGAFITTGSSANVLTNTGTITASTAAIYVTGTGVGAVTLNMHGGTINGAITKDVVSTSTVNLLFDNNAITTVNGAISNMTTCSIASGATAKLNGAYSTTAAITNNGTVEVNSTFSSGDITTTGLLDINGTFNSGNVTNSGTINVDASSTMGAIGNTSVININNTLNSGNITNSGTINIDAASTTGSISNTNILNVNATLAATGAITNSGTMTIAAQISGTGVLTNNGTLDLNANTNLGKQLTNTATLNINDSITSTSSINSTSGTVDLSNDISMTGTFSNTGSSIVTVNGARSMTAISYTNSGIHNTYIASSNVYDSLTITGNANMSSSTINVTASMSAGNGSWDIITSTGVLTASPAPTINLPPDDLFNSWNYSIGTNAITILNSHNPLEIYGTSPFNQSVAAALDAMSNNVTNPGQQTLLDAFFASESEEEINRYLQMMMPNVNAAAPILVLMQNDIFTKIEHRLSAIDTGLFTAQYGMNAGCIDPTTAIWLGGFGSFAKQGARGENFGYRSKSLGTMLGIDKIIDDDDFFGAALALSKSIVFEYSNQNFTSSIIGYHGLLYGSNYSKYNVIFEWLFSGAYTNTNGSRAINVNDVIMSTTSNFHGGQAAFRMNYGIRYCVDDMFTAAPLFMLQNVLLYQPNYTENYSQAALNVIPTKIQDIFTIGAGTRLSSVMENYWLKVSNEIRLMATYDAISTKNNVSANFVVGSPDFIMINTQPAPIAFVAGINVMLTMCKSVQLELNYDYQLRQQYYDHAGSAKIKLLF